MIETTIAEINVLELMERVRAKAEEIRRLEARPKLPPIAAVAQPPNAVLPTAVHAKTDKVIGGVHRARDATTVSRWIPKFLRGLFRRQGLFNDEMLRAVESLAHTNAQLADRLRHLTACVEVQDHFIHHLSGVRHADAAWMEAVSAIVVTFNERLLETQAAMQNDIGLKVRRLDDSHGALRGDFDARMGRMAEDLAALRDEPRVDRESFDKLRATVATVSSDVSEFGRRIAAFENSLGSLQATFDRAGGANDALRNDFEHAAEHLRNLQGLYDSLANALAPMEAQLRTLGTDTNTLRGDLERTGEHVRNLQGQVDQHWAVAGSFHSKTDVLQGEFHVVRDELNRAEEHLRNLQAHVDRALADPSAPARAHEALARLEQRITDDGSYLKGELSQQRSVIGQLLSGIGTAKQPAARRRKTTETDGLLDSFYVSFEDRFRGSRTEIKRRLEYYLPILHRSKAGTAGRPVIDVGCGRGEWLELLKDNKLESRGVDLNSAMRAQCMERGLNVSHGDAVEYLRGQPDKSAGGVTGFHIIEHLPLNTLLELFSQTFRVLQPGGVAIFESPNCKNLVVGACNFNIDPTHRNPVFPETAEFMLTLTGFHKVDLHYLSPVEGSPFVEASAASKFLHERLFGAQDFGVVGYKSAASA